MSVNGEAVTSPLSTKYLKAGGISYSKLANSLRNFPISFADQMQKSRILFFTRVPFQSLPSFFSQMIYLQAFKIQCEEFRSTADMLKVIHDM